MRVVCGEVSERQSSGELIFLLSPRKASVGPPQVTEPVSITWWLLNHNQLREVTFITSVLGDLNRIIVTCGMVGGRNEPELKHICCWILTAQVQTGPDNCRT